VETKNSFLRIFYIQKGGNMLKKKVWHVLTITLLLSLSMGALSAVTGDKPEFYKLTDLDKWIVNNRKTEIVTYKGKEALRLNEAMGTGIAYLKDMEFENGIIELDIAAIPRFTGLVFRAKDKDTYESIYFRPQNSRNPDKRENVVQYVSHPEYPWQVLRKNFPGKYEAALDIPPGEWFHVKVVVSGKEAKVFVNEAKMPCLVVSDLKHGISKGFVGILAGNTSGGTFANFRVTAFSKKASKRYARNR
jgi:hypothetical protein